MTDKTQNNKRIAKNVILLYLRMALLMIVSFYTSRVILKSLGATDFGLYNVIAGFIAMLGFIQGSMANGIQRFVSYSIKRKDKYNVDTILTASMRILFYFSIALLFLAETVGLWFFYNKMSIPINRLDAAFYVYQLSLLQVIVLLLSIPYNAMIIAYEKMNAFAYISILEVMCKLFIAIMISYSPIDKLVFYAILMLVVQVLVRIAYTYYCTYNISKIKIFGKCDFNIAKKLLGFIGWNTTSVCSEIIQMQGVNILLNIFFGPVVNAARAVSMQVMGVVRNFSINFLMAVNPQIIKSFASNDIAYTETLVFKSSKLGFFIMLCISAPVIMITEDLLNLWLVNVPEYAGIFIKLILCASIINVLIDPIKTAVNATGKIKNINICLSILMLSNIPISYILLRQGYEPYIVFVIQCIINILSMILCVSYMQKLVGIKSIKYYKNVLTRIIIVSIISVVSSIVILDLLPDKLIWRFIGAIILCLITALAAIFIGMNSHERSMLLILIKRRK